MLIPFDDVNLNARPDAQHDWLMSTAEVATGFGVSLSALRNHKMRNAEELVEGKHFVGVTNCDSFNNQTVIYWTKKGVVRLGFLVGSERARRFRDWAEDLVIKTIEQAQPAPYYLPQTKAEALRALAEEIEAHEATQLQLAAAAPKVEHYDRAMNAEGSYEMAHVAKIIGTGRNRLFVFLGEQNIFFRNRGRWQPYQQYVDSGHFIVRQKTFTRGTKEDSYPQLFVTPKGLASIRRRWDKINGIPFVGTVKIQSV